MKKTLVKTILLFLALGTLSGCVLYNGRNKDGTPKGGSSSSSESSESSSSQSSSDSGGVLPPAPTGNVNLYLVLGPNGKYDGAAGVDVPSMFLENTKSLTMAIGADLSDVSKKVTSEIDGSSFSHWINRETTEQVTTVPTEDSVLVAVFTGGDGSNAYNPSGIPTEGYGFMFNDLVDGKPYYKVGEDKGDVDVYETTYHQYQIQDFQLVAGQKFKLYDFGAEAGWTVDLDPYSCGAEGDAAKVALYVAIEDGFYVVKQTFNTNGIYIKLKYGSDNLYIGK